MLIASYHNDDDDDDQNLINNSTTVFPALLAMSMNLFYFSLISDPTPTSHKALYRNTPCATWHVRQSGVGFRITYSNLIILIVGGLLVLRIMMVQRWCEVGQIVGSDCGISKCNIG